ncbi:MAG: Septum site-determining protein MinD [Candidatus Heimdallarchaeota archaeon LC_3]|nr:MAG: Septum site-determining protein MinD [Candidatus Heimdallarchaeota archaeon LC_3]
MGKIDLRKDQKGIEKLTKKIKESENPLWEGTIESWFDKISYTEGNLILHFKVPVPENNSVFRNEFLQYLKKDLDNFEGIDNLELNLITDISSSIGDLKGRTIEKAKNIIAVASNKGGVGKSTVAYNIAAALQYIGAKVAILDLDIYGPSLPTMFGIKSPAQQSNAIKLELVNKYGMDLFSLGFVISEDQPIIFRAPIVDKLANQFFSGVQWNEVDYLVIDLPPGTGDVQLTLAQQLPHVKMIMVTTPNDVSQSDVTKGVRMFSQEGLNIEIIGIIENMSYFVCDECNTKHEIFSSGGAKDIADSFGIELLGEIPLYTDLRISGDKGKPIVIDNPDHQVSKKFISIAELISARIAQNNHEMYSKREKEVIIDLDLA